MYTPSTAAIELPFTLTSRTTYPLLAVTVNVNAVPFAADVAISETVAFVALTVIVDVPAVYLANVALFSPFVVTSGVFPL